MKKYARFFMAVIMALTILNVHEKAFCENQVETHLDYVFGDFLRYYENRGGERSYVTVRDTLGEAWEFEVNAVTTLIKRGDELITLDELVGGVKVTVMYRTGEEINTASVIEVAY